jgi:hypothetical protein
MAGFIDGQGDLEFTQAFFRELEDRFYPGVDLAGQDGGDARFLKAIFHLTLHRFFLFPQCAFGFYFLDVPDDVGHQTGRPVHID